MATPAADTMVILPLSKIADLLKQAAAMGIEVGEDGTRGDFTEGGIAAVVLESNNMLPVVDRTND